MEAEPADEVDDVPRWRGAAGMFVTLLGRTASLETENSGEKSDTPKSPRRARARQMCQTRDSVRYPCPRTPLCLFSSSYQASRWKMMKIVAMMYAPCLQRGLDNAARDSRSFLSPKPEKVKDRRRAHCSTWSQLHVRIYYIYRSEGFTASF